MSQSVQSILVLGIGNLLWADEGFGVRAVQALHARYRFPPQVTVLDGGTQGLYLLPYLQAAQKLIVFDAIDWGLLPATLKVVRGEEVPRFMGVKKLSLHQTGFQEVIGAAILTGRCPEEMLLIGVQPVELDDYGGSLREAVRLCIPQAVALAVECLRGWGVEAQEREALAIGEVLSAASLDLDAYEAGRPSAEQACRVGDARVLARVD